MAQLEEFTPEQLATYNRMSKNEYVDFSRFSGIALYTDKIQAIAAEFKSIHQSKPNCTIVFDDRFEYMVGDLMLWVNGYKFGKIWYNEFNWYNSVEPIVIQ